MQTRILSLMISALISFGAQSSEAYLSQNYGITVEWPQGAADCEPNPITAESLSLSRLYNKIIRDQHPKYPSVYMLPAKLLMPGDEVKIKMEQLSISDNRIDHLRVLHLDHLHSVTPAQNIIVTYRDVSDTTNHYLLKKSKNFRIDNHVLFKFGAVKTFRVLNCNPPDDPPQDGFTQLNLGCFNDDRPACVAFYFQRTHTGLELTR